MFRVAASRLFSVAAPIVEKKAAKILEILSKEKINWGRSSEPLHPYHTEINGQQVKLRVNDFPEDPTVYTVVHDGKDILDINHFMPNWKAVPLQLRPQISISP